MDWEEVQKLILTTDTTTKLVYTKAGISRETWFRIKKDTLRNKPVGIPVCCAIAYALGVAPDNLIAKKITK